MSTDQYQRTGDWMLTASGRMYWPIHPMAEDVCIEDIAKGLSNICRFGGQIDAFYSVAQHSVYVSRCVPQEHALTGLMHDATEAYVGDMVSPLKKSLLMVDFRMIEDLNWSAISNAFGLPYEKPACIKTADNAVLLAERDQLLVKHPVKWSVPGEPAPIRIERALPPKEAYAMFMLRFNELTRVAP